ncbi:hypothetical protein [Lysinibacillus sp. FSL K6-0102]|uniref:hypothetical protein n=1 Tax=Lysinibacillus sp. FSL K6-0102 TaxID=2975290 RepID=UPI0030FA25C2
MSYIVIGKYWKDNGECEEVTNKITFETKIEAYNYIKNMYTNKFEARLEGIKDGVSCTVIIDKPLQLNYSESSLELLWGNPKTFWYYVKELDI